MRALLPTYLYPIQPKGDPLSLGRLPYPSRVRRLLAQQSSRHASDVDARHHVRIGAVAAADTSEVRLRVSVRAGGVAALRAGAAGLAGVNEHHPNARLLSLVLHEVRQLSEGPASHHAVELLAPSDPIPDAVKLLQRQDGVGILGRQVYQLSADPVIQVSHPPALLALLGFHPVSAVVALVALAEGSLMFALMSNGFAVHNQSAVGMLRGGKAHYPEVNPDDGVSIAVTDGRGVGYAEGQHDIPVIAPLEQPSIALDLLKSFPPLRGDAEGEPDVDTFLPGGKPKGRANDLVAVDPEPYPLTTNCRRLSSPPLALAQPEVAPGELHGLVDRHAAVVGGQTQGPYRPIGGCVYLCPTTRSHAQGIIKPELRPPAEQFGGLVEPAPLARSGVAQLQYDIFCPVHENSIPQPSLRGAQRSLSATPFLPVASPRRGENRGIRGSFL